MNPRLLFIAYCFVAFIISYVPMINIPFNWLETVFHELSHALITVLTGGQVISFKLELNGAGLVQSRGGVSTLIAFSGYFGAACWGFILYQAGYSYRIVKSLIMFLVAGLILVTIFWIRDFLTLFIMLIIIGGLWLMLRNHQTKWLRNIGQFTGVFVLFNAIKSPLYLLDGQQRGDGSLLARLTFIPEFVWIVIWLGWGLFLLLKMWQLTKSLGRNKR